MASGNRLIGRRTALTLPVLGMAAKARAQFACAPPLVGAAAARTVRFVPYTNLIVMDPVWSISIVGLIHAYMTCDQLYGLDDQFVPRPQMAAGYEVSSDQLRWRFTLRDGLQFHDLDKVRAADCVASIARWAQRDPFGIRMAALTDKMTVIDDKTFEIRLKRPYSQMLYALGGTTCFIRPERLAKTSPFTAITDQTGSGPFRFEECEFVTGSRAVYVRHNGYVPRQEPAKMWAGGKMAYVERVEWHMLPDPATAAAALQKDEVDWLERPLFDLIPKLKSSAGVKVAQVDPMGFFGILNLNNAAPPFDNAKLRAALLPAINQQDFMAAVVGDQSDLARTGMGIFTPGSPFASDAGMSVLNGKRDIALSKRLIAESGYKDEKIVLTAPEIPEYRAMAEVTNGLFQQLGLNVDFQSMDWGTLSARQRSTDPKVMADWSCFCVGWAGLWPANPGSNIPLNGIKANPKMEALKTSWFEAPDLASQKMLAERMQLLAFEEPPFVPLGQYFIPYAFRAGMTGFVGAPVTAMWNVRKE
jgi:peptide/nickel transport system substrate-binding protein